MDRLDDMKPEDMRLGAMTEIAAHAIAIRTLLGPLLILEEQRVRQQELRDARKQKSGEALSRISA